MGATIEKTAALHYRRYLDILKDLVGQPSVFTCPGAVGRLMDRCRQFLAASLSTHRVYLDEQQNLIAVPRHVSSDRDLVYLSAHVDTVDADDCEWDGPYQPFTVYEDGDEMVGRGVSDCKAGVALVLFLSDLARKGCVSLGNLVLTLTFKEEGAGPKTAVAIGRAMGNALPVSRRDTYLIVLENTVTVGTPPVLSVYTAEKGNFVIQVKGTPDRLRQAVQRLAGWNPVCIVPQTGQPVFTREITQAGGHACSVPRGQNRLAEQLLIAGADSLIEAGDPDSFSVVPTRIRLGRSDAPVQHTLVLSNRSFDRRETVKGQLAGMDYRPLKDFSISEGMDISSKWAENKISSVVRACQRDRLPIRMTGNTGTSDASIIYNCLAADLRRRFYPMVTGPGSRSQREADPRRLTHGKNETFDKRSGKRALACILGMLARLGAIGAVG